MTLLRIASVPTDHVYVRHLSSVSGAHAVVRLPDPPVAGAVAGQWWPSPVLDPAWLHRNAADFDLVHLHFGFEHLSSSELVGFVASLSELGRPLVFTVHDLTNPHLVDQRPHAAALDVLVAAADAVLTLTPGAAAEISRRWGRRATALGHPHVVALERMAWPRPRHEGFVIGVHDKRRANIDPAAVRDELTRTVAELPGAVVHPGHPHRLSDAELWDHLADLDVLVLPYRFGTHSGFVEACYDLGTTVVAARTGFLAEQQPLLSYDLDEPGSLATALHRAFDERPAWRAHPEMRAAQREELAAAHADIYCDVVAARAA